jgi:broad specificity phosphatase PhoE
MQTLVLVRHAHASSNAAGQVSGCPPGGGLTQRGRAQARAARRSVASLGAEVGVASAFARAQETLRLLAPWVPQLVVPELGEIGFGAFEGQPLDAYRGWAWTAGPAEACPGGGESRAGAAARLARGLALLRERPERTILAVSHSMPIRYVLDAAEGRAPGRRLAAVGHVEPIALGARAVRLAGETLAAWAREPAFADAPNGA